MRIEILDAAQEDLIEGFRFYEEREPGVGRYFLDCLFSDIDSLILFAGIHQTVYGHHLSLKTFPFRHLLRCARRANSRAFLDCRKNPLWIRQRLRRG